MFEVQKGIKQSLSSRLIKIETGLCFVAAFEELAFSTSSVCSVSYVRLGFLQLGWMVEIRFNIGH
jgi:hypothetical protein